MKDAIKKAIEGGWNGLEWHEEVGVEQGLKYPIYAKVWGRSKDGEAHGTQVAFILLDPLFWQALGKSLGWQDTEIFMDDYTNDHPFMGGTIDYPYGEGAGMTYRVSTWKYQMHLFIDHLAEGKDIETFFTNLLHQ